MSGRSWRGASDLAREAERQNRQAEDAERHARAMDALRSVEGRHAQAEITLDLIEAEAAAPVPPRRWYSPLSWFQRDFQQSMALQNIRKFVEAYNSGGNGANGDGASAPIAVTAPNGQPAPGAAKAPTRA